MKTDTKVILAGAALLVLGAWYASRKLGALGDSVAGAVASAGEWAVQNLNPASTENVAYRGVNAVGGALVSDPAGAGKNADGSWSLGAWLYDIAHKPAFDPYASTMVSAAAVNDARQIDRIMERQAANTGGTTGSW
jgi:hypothetical protein